MSKTSLFKSDYTHLIMKNMPVRVAVLSVDEVRKYNTEEHFFSEGPFFFLFFSHPYVNVVC